MAEPASSAEPVALNGSAYPAVAAGEQDLRLALTEVRDTALHLVTTLSRRPPHSLRLRARDVEVEIEWNGAPAPDGPAGAVAPAAAAVPPAEEPVSDQLFVTAPAVGVFYRSPSPGAPPFVEVGDVIEAGQQVAIVEAMKLMIPVASEQSGRVTAVLKDDGEAVEYGENIVALDPSAQS